MPMRLAPGAAELVSVADPLVGAGLLIFLAGLGGQLQRGVVVPAGLGRPIHRQQHITEAVKRQGLP